MNIEEYNQVITAFRNNADSMARSKRVEYTESRGDKDVHANFRATAAQLGISPEMVIIVFLQKHFSSIVNYVKTGKTFSDESIEGRIADAVQYLELLHALIKERRDSHG